MIPTYLLVPKATLRHRGPSCHTYTPSSGLCPATGPPPRSYNCPTCTLAAYLHPNSFCVPYLCLSQSLITYSPSHLLAFVERICPWPWVSASPEYLVPHSCSFGTTYPFLMFYVSHFLFPCCTSHTSPSLHLPIPHLFTSRITCSSTLNAGPVTSSPPISPAPTHADLCYPSLPLGLCHIPGLPNLSPKGTSTP